MITAATAAVALGVMAVVAAGFWLLVAPSVPESDRIGLALEVGLVALVSGAVAYVLGQIGGRVSEREASRRAAEQTRIRREREAAELAARQAERAQLALREAEAVRQLAPPAGNAQSDPTART